MTLKRKRAILAQREASRRQQYGMTSRDVVPSSRIQDSGASYVQQQRNNARRTAAFAA